MAPSWTSTVAADDPVEVVIGMRWPHLWRLAVRPWVPLAFARMVLPQEGSGLERTRIGVRPAGPVLVQRWSSRAAVDAWARDRKRPHNPSWQRFARDVGRTGDWGVWHEMETCRPKAVAHATTSAL